MKQYVLDANAVNRYLMKGPGIERLDRLFAQGQLGEAGLSISVINRGEALYTLAKQIGWAQSMQTLQILTHYIESVDATEERVDRAASLRFFYKLGYGDSFAAQLALEKGATLVTADPDFAKLGKQLKILALPRHA